jgi:hypothetical protein
MKTVGGKKGSREEAAGSAGGSTLPVSPPCPNPNKQWKKSKAKTEDLLALLNSGFLRDNWQDHSLCTHARKDEYGLLLESSGIASV